MVGKRPDRRLPTTIRVTTPVAGGPLAVVPAVGAPQAPQPDAIKIDYLGILRRNGFIIVLSLVASLGAARVYLTHTIHRYSSTARIFIRQAPVKVLGESQTEPQAANFLATQCEVIKSMHVLSIAARLPALKTLPTLVHNSDVASALRQDLGVSLDKGVDVISISFVSPSPMDAAAIVNGMARSYADFYAEQNGTASQELLQSLTSEKAKREAELAERLKALNDFKRSSGIAYGPDSAVQASNRLARVVEAQTEARLALVNAKGVLGADNPTLVAAQEREKNISQYLTTLRSEMVESNSQLVEFSMLEGDVSRIQKTCEQIDDRIKQVALNSGDTGSSHVAVLEEGRPDFTPVQPSRNRTLGLAGMMGLVFSCGLALLRERADGRLRDPEEAASLLRLPLLGVIPNMQTALGIVGRGQSVHLDPMSSIAESYRKVRTAIYFGTPKEAGQSLLVTSPAAGDGKSTTAANLAIAMAQTGERVLLVDADLRRPTQHTLFGIKNDTGLATFLAGRCTLEQAIRPSVVGRLDVMPSGPLPPNPSEMLNTNFAVLLSEVRERYDRVIFDSPPALAVSDARILGAHTDVTLLALRAGKSTAKMSADTCAGLSSVGANVFGFVMNGIKGFRAQYGDYGYGYWYPDRRPAASEFLDERSNGSRPRRIEDAAIDGVGIGAGNSDVAPNGNGSAAAVGPWQH